MTVLQSQSLGYQGLTINIANANGIGQPAKQLDTPVAKDHGPRRPSTCRSTARPVKSSSTA